MSPLHRRGINRQLMRDFVPVAGITVHMLVVPASPVETSAN
jgi:hypothetical protein